MQVILLERVGKLGAMGDVVSVRDGYARNFLLPQKKALWASKDNIDAFAEQKADLEKQNAETRAAAERFGERLAGETFVLIRQASDRGALYGSVTTRDAAEAATEAGHEIDRRQVALNRPIKELGIHPVTVVLHPEVEVEVNLNVARSPEEAELQAQGKSVGEAAIEEEAQAEYEIEQLFEDLGAAQLDEVESAPEDAVNQPAVQEKSTLDDKLDR